MVKHEDLYPFWLNFKDVIKSSDGYKCPYCHNIFRNKDDAYPRLVQTFESFQNDSKKYIDISNILEAHWRSNLGHPCTAFTSHFWNAYNEYKKSLGITLTKTSRNREYNNIEKNDYLGDYNSEQVIESTLYSSKNKVKSTPNRKKYYNFKNFMDSLKSGISDSNIIKASVILSILYSIIYYTKFYTLLDINTILESEKLNNELSLIVNYFLLTILISRIPKINSFLKRTILPINLYNFLAITIYSFITLYTVYRILEILNISKYLIIPIIPFSIFFFYFIVFSVMLHVAIYISHDRDKRYLYYILLFVSISILIINSIKYLETFTNTFSSFQDNTVPKKGIGKNYFTNLSNYNESTKRQLIDYNKKNPKDSTDATSPIIYEYFPKIIPTNDSGYIKKKFYIKYWYSDIYLNLKIPISIYNGAKRGIKDYSYMCMGRCQVDNDWEVRYYNYFIHDTHQDTIYQDIINELYEYSNNDNEFVELASLFVQLIPYDYNKSNLSDFDYRFPVEVLVDNLGVCSEKSMLLAGILSKAGYNVVLLLFEDANHMAVGVKCSCNNDFKDSGYCYIETTNLNGIGYVPRNLSNGADLYSSDFYIIDVSNGTKIYTNCKYIDEESNAVTLIIEEYIKNMLMKTYGLIYDHTLSSNIDNIILPEGYEKGTIWKLSFSKGSPKYLATILYYQIEKNQNLKSNISFYRYFGISYNISKGELKLFLAK